MGLDGCFYLVSEVVAYFLRVHIELLHHFCREGDVEVLDMDGLCGELALLHHVLKQARGTLLGCIGDAAPKAFKNKTTFHKQAF